MAHPKRAEFLPYLLEKLGNCQIAMDEGHGLWKNARRAWKMYDPNADYHVVIQDDAIVCNKFKERALETIKQSEKVFKNGPHLINFYYDNILAPITKIEEIINQGYITRSKVCWAVAICMPVSLIDEMLSFADSINDPRDDERITGFMRSKRLKCYFPIPSLIDHRTDATSLVGNVEERKAWKFIE